MPDAFIDACKEYLHTGLVKSASKQLPFHALLKKQAAMAAVKQFARGAAPAAAGAALGTAGVLGAGAYVGKKMVDRKMEEVKGKAKAYGSAALGALAVGATAAGYGAHKYAQGKQKQGYLSGARAGVRSGVLAGHQHGYLLGRGVSRFSPEEIQRYTYTMQKQSSEDLAALSTCFMIDELLEKDASVSPELKVALLEHNNEMLTHTAFSILEKFAQGAMVPPPPGSVDQGMPAGPEGAPPAQMPPEQMPPEQMPPEQMPPDQMPPEHMPPQGPANALEALPYATQRVASGSALMDVQAAIAGENQQLSGLNSALQADVISGGVPNPSLQVAAQLSQEKINVLQNYMISLLRQMQSLAPSPMEVMGPPPAMMPGPEGQMPPAPGPGGPQPLPGQEGPMPIPPEGAAGPAPEQGGEEPGGEEPAGEEPVGKKSEGPDEADKSEKKDLPSKDGPKKKK